MKKLLVLLALCMVISVALVACDNGEQSGEQTTAGTTEAPTEEPTTEAPTTEKPTTEEPTTEAPTTEEPTTEEPTTEAPTTEEPTTEAPVEPDNSYRVDLGSVTVTGSYPNIYTGATALFPTTPAVSADAYVITLHYGSINLGEIDLSKYSKVTVTYATAADGLIADSDFKNQYEATGQRVLLLNAPSEIEGGSAFELLPAEDAIVATAHYEISNSFMEIMTVEIDLSAIDYNGPLYLSFDFRNSENAFGALGYLLSVTDVVFE